MYIVVVHTEKSRWHYGPFASTYEARRVAEAHKLMNYIVVQLIPISHPQE